MESIQVRCGRGEVLLADGAMGSLLIARGLERGAAPESLNLSRSDVLEEIARLYLEAGAEIVQTNTFGASPLKLAKYGLEGRAAEINTAAVAAVRRAVGDKAYVSASCGPTGRLLLPFGDTPESAIFDGFLLQIDALVKAGADAICVETMTDLNEARLAVQAARRVAPGVTVMATMTFEPTTRGFFTIMGVSIPAACRGLEEAGADLVGSNCGNGSAQMADIAREFRKSTRLPLLIQANAGIPELRQGQVHYPETPAFMAATVPELLDAGVSVIGGCCGTTPDHTRAMRTALEKYKQDHPGRPSA
jgi:5-methyltetrahydrofolate--homocysteine methyltransferase